ncbi:uncharacterized protein [Hoplias malabaricus]|uniref:uncharacterized protein n=1 Tax=Hoplias malabaricus TaxID=27720 RepID=UPI003461E343
MAWTWLLLFVSLISSLSFTGNVSAGVVLKDEEYTVETTFKKLCGGIEVELKDCNERLTTETEYSTKINIELLTLKRQVRQMRLSCIDSAEASSVQITALQTLLDSLLKQLGEKASGPAKHVLTVLQKYITIKRLEMEITTTMPTSKVTELENQLKEAESDMNLLSANLSRTECPSGDSSQFTEINDLQEQIERLLQMNTGSETSEITELRRQLKEKLKNLEETSGIPKQVSDVVRQQEELLIMEKRLSKLLKSQAEYFALADRLQDQTMLLLELKEEQKERGTSNELDQQIASVEREVLDMKEAMEALNITLSQRPALETQLQEKIKLMNDKLLSLKTDQQELVYRILKLQYELQQRKILAQTQKEVAEIQIIDLENRLGLKQELIGDLQFKNRRLERQILELKTDCDNLSVAFNEISDKMENIIKTLPDVNIQNVMDIMLLTINIENIKTRLRTETSQSKIKELEKELQDKINQLTSKRNDLQISDTQNSERILKILDKMEEIQTLQRTVESFEGLDKISSSQKELMELISKLDETNPVKLVLKHMVKLLEMNWLKNLITSITQQTESQVLVIVKQVQEKEELLKRKTAELTEREGDVQQLSREILVLKEEVKQLKEQINSMRQSFANQLKVVKVKLRETEVELETLIKALNQKNEELATKVNKITELMEELRRIKQEALKKHQETAGKIIDLEERIRQSEEDKLKVKVENRKLQLDLEEAKKCSEVQESYKELQAKFKREVSQLNNSFARQILVIQTMSEEVEALQRKLSTSEGNTDVLEEQLRNKTADLEKVKKELRLSRADSAELLKLLESMRKLSKQKDQSISEYLAEIDRLEKETEGLMDKLGKRGDEKSQLTIQVISLNEELGKLQRLQEQLKQEAAEKVADLEKSIEEKRTEIIYLQKIECGTGQLKTRVAQLEREMNEKEKELDKVKKFTAEDLRLLEKKIVETSEKLEISGEQLKKTDEQNVELIKKLAALGEQLQKATKGNEEIKQTAEKQIKDLKERLQQSEEDKLKVKVENRKLQLDLEEAKKCSEVQESYEELQAKFKREVSQLNNSFAGQVLVIQTMSEEVEALQRKLSTSEGNTDALEEQLRNKTANLEKVKKELRLSRADSAELLKVLESMRKLSRQQGQSISEYLAEIDRLEMETEGLMDKLGKRGDEKSKLTIQVISLKEELGKLQRLQEQLKQEAAEKVADLEKSIVEKRTEIIYLKKIECGTGQLKNRVAQLEQDVTAKEKELDRVKKSTAEDLRLLEKKMVETSEKLESSGAKLKETDEQNVDLIKKLADLGGKLNEATSGNIEIKQTSEKRIKDLKEEVKNKEKENSELKNTNTDLKERLQQSEEDKLKVKVENRKLQLDLEEAKKCSAVQESYEELQAKFKREVSQLNNSFAGQVLVIQTMSEEVEALQRKLSTSEGNTDALEEQLRNKTANLEKVKKELRLSRADSAELLKLLESMRKLSRQKDQSISEYLAEIDRLEKETEGLMDKLGKRGDEKSQLTIKVISLKEELGKLQRLQEQLKQEAAEKVADLEKSIEAKRTEIIYLQKIECGTGQLKTRVAQLEREVKEKEKELDQVKKSSAEDLRLLEKKMVETSEKLDSSGEKLKETDEQNVELIKKLAALGEQLQKAAKGNEEIKQTAEKQIKDLKQQVKDKEKEILELQNINTALNKALKKTKEEVAEKEETIVRLKDELSKKSEENQKVKESCADFKQQVKDKETEFLELQNTNAALNKALKKTKEEVDEKGVTIARLRDELSKKSEENQNVKESCADLKQQVKDKETEILDLQNTNAALNKALKKTKEEVEDKEVAIARQRDELSKKAEELKKAKQAYTDVQSENDQLMEEIAKANATLKELQERLPKDTVTQVIVDSPELDLNTAHRRLLITNGGKVIRGSESARPVQNTPQRYDSALAAVAKTGYDSGRHYWEIQVEGRACFLVGVVKGSAQRKGEIRYGPDNGYWGLLKRKDGRYIALTTQPTPLKLDEKLSVIGIMLDFDKEVVAFYNAQSKTLLYAFQNSIFSEKIFPYVETCTDQRQNEQPIIISDPQEILWKDHTYTLR